MTTENLKTLEYLSLISQVCVVLENNLDVADKVLAEFITELGRTCSTVDEFGGKLQENGAELQDYVVETIFTLIHTILKPEFKVKASSDRNRKRARDRVAVAKPEVQRHDRKANSTSHCGTQIEEEESRRALKRKSAHERWEAKQLFASGAFSVKEYLHSDDEEEGDVDKEVEIELNDEKPAFLQGLMRNYSIDMSPVRVFKDPQGSLSRAAATGYALVKERREIHVQEKRRRIDSISKDLNRPWEDPMPENGERRFAQELRGDRL